MESVTNKEEFDPDIHPVEDVTLTNAILVDKLCTDNLHWQPVLDYAEGAAAGLRDQLYAMCETHGKFILNYRMSGGNPSSGWRASEWEEFYNLYERISPPKETAQE